MITAALEPMAAAIRPDSMPDDEHGHRQGQQVEARLDDAGPEPVAGRRRASAGTGGGSR